MIPYIDSELSAHRTEVKNYPASNMARNLTANGTYAIRTGSGTLKRIVINTKGGTGNVLQIYNGTTASAPLIGTLDTTDRVGPIEYNAEFYDGLLVVLAGGTAADLTIIYDTDEYDPYVTTSTNVWKGQGVNYKSQSHVDTDIIYFKSIGLNTIRTHIPFYTDSTIASWRAVAKKFCASGFTVIFGLSWNQVTSAGWQVYHDAIIAEAIYDQQNGICTHFVIGNELETHITDGTSSTQIRSNIRQLATDVKTALIAQLGSCNLKIVYAVEGTVTGDNHGSIMWCSEGKGDLDYLSMNTYGTWVATQMRYSPTYTLTIPTMVAAFGTTGWFISEYNVEQGSNFSIMPAYRAEKELGIFQRYMQKQGVPFACLFQYRGFLDSNADTQLQMRFSDNTFRRMWFAVVPNTGRVDV